MEVFWSIEAENMADELEIKNFGQKKQFVKLFDDAKNAHKAALLAQEKASKKLSEADIDGMKELTIVKPKKDIL